MRRNGLVPLCFQSYFLMLGVMPQMPEYPWRKYPEQQQQDGVACSNSLLIKRKA